MFTAALAMYQTILNLATNDTIEGDRKLGINKDCLALIYKAACAYNIPYCKVDTEVV